jgi:hypothetical protein
VIFELGIDLDEGPLLARRAAVMYFDPLARCYEQFRGAYVALVGRKDRAVLAGQITEAVRERIASLKDLAFAESLSISASSESDLFQFLKMTAVEKRPSVFLLESGNFRFVWKNARGEQIGVQFLGDGVVQFVLFAYRTNAQMVVRSCGRDSVEGILQQIDGLRLSGLIHEQG